MKKYMLSLLMLLCFTASTSAWAITLEDAKRQGLVGEKVDGYIAAVTPTPSAELLRLIDKTNSGRREVYQGLAERNDVTVEAIGILSAEKLREKAASGEYVQSPGGQWQKK